METSQVTESLPSENTELDESVNSFLEVKLEPSTSPVFEASFIETDNKILRFKCPICKKKFKNKEKVRNHVNSHITVHSIYTNGDYKCLECNSYLEDMEGFRLHMEKHKKTRGRPRKGSVGDDDEKPFICDKCAKSFKRKQQLLNHCLVHFDLKPYECDQCEKCFKLKQQLQNHLKVHYDVRPFTCATCEKSFKFKQQLENHTKSHTDIRPFKCVFCDKAFKFKQQLQTHCRVHDDLRPFQCDCCHKAFKLKQQLQFHNKVHSDERPFECLTCGKSFKLKQQLKTHLKVHAKSFVDSICEPVLGLEDQSFMVTKEELAEHMGDVACSDLDSQRFIGDTNSDSVVMFSELETQDFMGDTNADSKINGDVPDNTEGVTCSGLESEGLMGKTNGESVSNGGIMGNVACSELETLGFMGDANNGELADKARDVTASNGEDSESNLGKVLKKCAVEDGS